MCMETCQVGTQGDLVEKGRGVGGRMATRRMEGARIDHGAQFFTVRDSRMEELLSLWVAEKLLCLGMIIFQD